MFIRSAVIYFRLFRGGGAVEQICFNRVLNADMYIYIYIYIYLSLCVCVSLSMYVCACDAVCGCIVSVYMRSLVSRKPLLFTSTRVYPMKLKRETKQRQTTAVHVHIISCLFWSQREMIVAKRRTNKCGSSAAEINRPYTGASVCPWNRNRATYLVYE